MYNYCYGDIMKSMITTADYISCISCISCISLPQYSEEFPPIIMPNKLIIFPASHISRDDINSGDKVILSPEILMACEQRQLTYPMVSMLYTCICTCKCIYTCTCTCTCIYIRVFDKF